MANEVSVTVGLSVTNGNFSFRKPGKTFRVNQSVRGGAIPGIVKATNAAGGVVIDMADITTPGWAWLENIDDTAVVQIGIYTGATFYPFASLGPGEAFPIPLDSAVKATTPLRAKSSIAASDLQAFILED